MKETHFEALKPHHDYIMRYPTVRSISQMDASSGMMQLFIRICAERGHPILKTNCGACLDNGIMFIHSYYSQLLKENENEINTGQTQVQTQKSNTKGKADHKKR